MSGSSKFGGSTKPVIRSNRPRKGGKAQPVIVVSGDAHLESGASQPIVVVDDDYVAAHGLISGAAKPVIEVTNRHVRGGKAIPVYVIAGSFSGGGNPPVADFTADVVSGVAPLTVNFTDLSTNTPTSWLWNFGDTNTSGAQNPSHTYNNPGTYTVTLTATNAAASDTETKTNYITVTAPFVGFLDGVSNVEHVYLLLRGLSTYSSALVRIRRDSDNAELDFTYVSAADESLNVAAITAWLAGANPFIVTIYDQAVADDDITQGTAGLQPAITLSSANFNNKPVSAPNGGQYLQGAYTNGGTMTQPNTFYTAARRSGGNQDNIISGIIGTSRNDLYTGVADWRIYAGGSEISCGAFDTLSHIFTTLFNGASSQLWKDGVSAGSGNAGAHTATGLTMCARYDGIGQWTGQIAGVIVVDGNSSNADKNVIGNKFETYYNISYTDI